MEQEKRKQGRPKGSKDKTKRKQPEYEEKKLGDHTVRVAKAASRKKALSKDCYIFYQKYLWAPQVKINSHDTTELEARTEEFFQFCEEKDIFPFWTTYCIALGVNVHTVTDYREGRLNCPQESRDILKKVAKILEDAVAQRGMADSFAAPFAIWKEKSVYGKTEKLEIAVQHSGLLATDQTSDDVIKKLAMSSVPELDVVETIPADSVFDALEGVDFAVIEDGEEEDTTTDD